MVGKLNVSPWNICSSFFLSKGSEGRARKVKLQLQDFSETGSVVYPGISPRESTTVIDILPVKRESSEDVLHLESQMVPSPVGLLEMPEKSCKAP